MSTPYVADPQHHARVAESTVDTAESVQADARTMRIIGLTGLARSGKDSVGQAVQTLHEGSMVHVKTTGFAHLLKLSVARLFYPDIGLRSALDWCDWLKDNADIVVEERGVIGVVEQITGRQLLQRYGTEAHRDTFHEDFWLDAVLPEGRNDCDVLVVMDVRFENEAQRVLDRGGEVWKIERPGVEPVDGHSSEDGIPDSMVTRTIVNDGTLEDLRNKVDAAL